LNKRILMVAGIVAATAMALTGCSTTPSSTSSTGTSSKHIKVAFVSQIEGIPYFNGFHDGASKEAKLLGVSYTQAGPSKADSTQQVQILDNLVSQGYNAISISPLDPTSINNSIKKAQAAGVKIATSDADAADSSRSVYVSEASNEGLGSAVMDQAANAAGGSGEFAIISGQANVASFNDWIDAAKAEQAKKWPNMKLVGGVQYTTNTADALQAAQNLITANPNLKSIIAVPSTAVPGVGQAITTAGKLGKVSFVGFGSPQTSAPFLKSGAMYSSVLWNVPQLGALDVWAMTQLAEGKKFAAENTVPGFKDKIAYDGSTKVLLLGKPYIFTKDNYSQFNF
jgi:rhamnose transport system substrate-binding protein